MAASVTPAQDVGISVRSAYRLVDKALQELDRVDPQAIGGNSLFYAATWVVDIRNKLDVIDRKIADLRGRSWSGLIPLARLRCAYTNPTAEA